MREGRKGVHTWWECQLWVLEVEVYDFGKRVYFCDFELPYKVRKALFELGIWRTLVTAFLETLGEE